MLFMTCRHLTLIFACFGSCSFSLLHPMQNQKKNTNFSIIVQESQVNKKIFIPRNQGNLSKSIGAFDQTKTMWSIGNPETINSSLVKTFFHNLQAFHKNKKIPLFYSFSELVETIQIGQFFSTPQFLNALTKKAKKKYNFTPKQFLNPELLTMALILRNLKAFNDLYHLIKPTPISSPIFQQKQLTSKKTKQYPRCNISDYTFDVRVNQKRPEKIYLYNKKHKFILPLITFKQPITAYGTKNNVVLATTQDSKSWHWNIDYFEDCKEKISLRVAVLIHELQHNYKVFYPSQELTNTWNLIPSDVRVKIIQKHRYRLPSNLQLQ